MGKNPEFVKFDKVDKSYDGKVLVVKDLQLDIAEGEFITMLGPSGSGKTTIINLFLGFLEPTGGNILINNKVKLSNNYWRSQISYMPQDIFLFDDTIKTNLTLKETINDQDILLLSHSVTPEIDSVEKLNKYAKTKGVNASKWNLVTGDKKQIYDLARKSYLAVKDNENSDPYDMIHTENFMLIDHKKQIRGFYDGTDPEAIEDLLDDIKLLKASLYN